MRRRASRVVGLLGLAGLVAMCVAYSFTREAAPRIRVLWRDDITAQEQAAFERRYSLFNGRDRLPEGSIAYDLLDTSRSNIMALVEDRAVDDTNDVDRNAYLVPAGVDRGTEWTWIAHRIPGLRRTWSRWAVLLLLAAAAVVGLRREALAGLAAGGRALRRLVKAWNADRARPAGSRDPFDVIPWQTAAANPAIRRGSLPIKMVTALLLLLAAAPPVLATWEALALAALLLALIFGECRRGVWRLPVVATVVLAGVGLKGALPRADIAEAHNAFLVVGDGEPLEQGLPPEVFNSWRAQFEELYPKRDESPPESSWRAQKLFPKALYTRSTDAIWRPAKFTRQIDAIDFRNLAEFRGGFAGEVEYNFWTGDLAREEMPFYAMYELTPASVGSRLRWRGQVFWERSDGRYDEIRHEQIGERTITSDDAGRRVYAVFFPKRNIPFDFRLIPSPTLRLAGWAEAVLTLLGIGAVAILVRPRWREYLRATSIFLIAYCVVIAGYAEPSSARLGRQYLPHGGGNDGLPYEAHGRTMAILAGSGRVVEALKGVEPIFGSTPGTRYVRMVEKLIFGDTNHLFALLLAGIPIVFFYLMRRLIGALPAWIVTGGFLVLPIEHLSFMQYFTSGRAGYADWLGAGLFLLGLTLVLYHEPGAPHRALAHVWAGGAALAASMCIRPHVAFAVGWVGFLYLWLSWSRRDVAAALAMAGGLMLVLCVPFHNWYYSPEFFLISRPSSTSFSAAGWQDYMRAPLDLLLGRSDSPAVVAIRTQLEYWLWNPGFAYAPSSTPLQWAARIIRVAALALTGWVTFMCVAGRWRARTDVAFIVGAALCAHAAMLFVFGHHQRYLLAWDLSMMVLIVWLVVGSADTPRHAVVDES